MHPPICPCTHSTLQLRWFDLPQQENNARMDGEHTHQPCGVGESTSLKEALVSLRAHMDHRLDRIEQLLLGQAARLGALEQSAGLSR